MIESVRGPWLRRCCRNEIHRHAARTNCLIPVDGFELECAHCLSRIRWSLGAWEWIEPLYLKESHADATAARHARAEDITRGKFSLALAKLNTEKKA